MPDVVAHPSRAAAYLDYHAQSEYERVAGTLVIPCVDGAPVVIDTHEPYRVKRVTYAGRGRGEPTVMPRPDDAAKLLTHTHTVLSATPFQSGEGNNFVYSCVGGYAVVETGAVGLLSTAEYDLPKHPFRLEPMATQANANGYDYYPGELTTGGPPAEFNPASETSRWPQALTITSTCFSDSLA